MAKILGFDTDTAYGTISGESSVGQLLALVVVEAAAMLVLRYVSRHHHGG